MSVYPPPPLSRDQEKAELQHLGDRVQNYIGKNRKVREGANNIDSSALLNAINVLEDEVQSIKNTYDKELQNKRRDLDDIAAVRNQAEVQASRNGQLAADLQDRLTVENQRNRGLTNEVAGLQQMCAQKEGDLQQAKAEGEDLKRKVRDLEDDCAALQRRCDDTERRLDQETALKHQAQDEKQALQNKADFQQQVHDQETKENKNRLEDKTNLILALEAKIRELSKPDNTLHDMLNNVREAAAAELQKFKDEAEEAYHNNLEELRNQMDIDAANFAKLSDENKRLGAAIEDLERENHSLQTKLATSEHQNRNLTSSLGQERERTSAHIRALEDKLRDMQDSLVQKMRDISYAVNSKQPVRAELEAMKAMLQEEEKKLVHIPGPPIPSSPSPVPSPVNSRRSVSPIRPLPSRSSMSSPIRPYENTTGLSSSMTSPKPLSTKRPASVPVGTMGQGKDYFDSIFGDLQKHTAIYPRLHPKSSPPGPRLSSTSHDYTTCTSSTTGDIKILEVNEDGKFIRLFNTSSTNDVEVGGYMIQQNIGGHPVAVYRFAPRTRFRAGSTITVWSASSLAQHNPPTDYLWKEQNKWGTGPECTSILCKPNGQAIAWTTAAHRFTKTARSYANDSDTEVNARGTEDEEDNGMSNPNPEFETEMDGKVVTALKREKQDPPSLSPLRHPHGQYTGHGTHPGTGEPRVLSMGNDNSSLCRQSRSQNNKPVPDVIGGDLYAGSGISASRTGSAPLRRPMPSKPQSAGGSIRYGAQPSPFMSPHQQHYSGLNKVTAQHHVSFQPPLPRTPVISSW
ncbi:lamin-B2.L-like [Amphiura filiformis]|uniref:lamin-B2.L-like n=1 Tax=Amphiura filiformis TaxID=82378 RepID=UPI003B2115C3